MGLDIQGWMQKAACGHCGSREYITRQRVETKQRYYGGNDTWDASVVLWDTAEIIGVECAGCHAELWAEGDWFIAGKKPGREEPCSK